MIYVNYGAIAVITSTTYMTPPPFPLRW